MARLYADENFPKPVVVALRALGHDVLTTEDAGRSDQEIPDDEVLAFAIAERRGVLTLNRRHFIWLHRQRPSHAGIVVCTFDADFSAQAARIDEAIASRPSLAGELISGESWRSTGTICRIVNPSARELPTTSPASWVVSTSWPSARRCSTTSTGKFSFA